MLVKMPGLEKIPVNLRNCITRPKKIANEKNQSKKLQEKMLTEFLQTYVGCSEIC